MKFLSSIFSSETVDFKPAEVFTPTVKLVLAGYVLFEVLVRSFIPSGQYPTGRWRDNELRIQTYQLKETKDVDILFAGSSICAANIAPVHFDNELSKSNISFTSFNTGIRGCDYEGVAEGFKKLFWIHKQAEYVMLVVSPFDLNEINYTVRERTGTFIENINLPEYEAAIIDFLSDASWIIGFRGEFKELIKRREWQYQKPVNGERGYIPFDREQELPEIAMKVRIQKDSVCSVSLIEFVDWLLEQNVRVAIVEGLMFSEERKKLDPVEMEKFYNILDLLDKKKNVRFWDTGDIMPEDKYFVDRIHLNPEGAEKYSRDLARKFIDAGFPW